MNIHLANRISETAEQMKFVISMDVKLYSNLKSTSDRLSQSLILRTSTVGGHGINSLAVLVKRNLPTKRDAKPGLSDESFCIHIGTEDVDT